MKDFVKLGRKIVAIGRNFSDHAKELGNAVPTTPFFFLKPTTSFVTMPGKVEVPKCCEVHHEIELGVVIGKGGRDISKSSAMNHVAGYAIGIDMTARNLQEEAKKKGLPWSTAKGFDTFTPVGSFLERSAIKDPQDVDLWLKVNGELKQKGNTRDMIFPVADLISHVSGIMRLEPGDFILTGTPKGVGPVRQGDTISAGLRIAGEDISRVVFEVVERELKIKL
ncbi:hypothetical protein BKA69DRAFT_1043935 [Paraphysoderma sedebokerense]|nr:hypothetical protein BKA69DRAFT_1043935 [Paraphysoderma sedebokerense]